MSKLLSRTRNGLLLTSMLVGFGSIGIGCLTRPVVSSKPEVKTNFTTNVKQTAVDKVDLLFAIDNSQSMGDKQSLLKEAVPDLINRLLEPKCVDDNDAIVGDSIVDTNPDGPGRACTTGKLEFPPVVDLHVGIMTSSLGGRGGDACKPGDTYQGVNRHNDDQAHLINRGDDAAETPISTMGSSNYLAWLPYVKKNDGKDAPANTTRITDKTLFTDSFTKLVVGVHEHGCGYEAQMESVYRFLIQPDPYDSIQLVDVPGQPQVATLQGVDATILQQRKDFLRPDSLVAVIMLTDENDSTVDPQAFAGRGWLFENSGTVLGGTDICATDPLSPDCKSCYVAGCSNPPSGGTGDDANERFFDMKRRFGVDPRFPYDRYVKGFRDPKVPNRDGEHIVKNNIPSDYIGTENCVNPLYAAALPGPESKDDPKALCNLKPGVRTKDQIFFALIGGVPWQLLTDKPDLLTTANDGNFKSKLEDADWVRILGKDYAHYDFTGQSPFMVESLTPRADVQAIPTASQVNTREWNTNNQDLQYACTFSLPARDCTDKDDQACACGANLPGGASTDSPLCDDTVKTKQIRAKAYPTIQELRVARDMSDQGIVASICPRSLDTSNANYGYRPAVASIVDRLRNALANQCLPQKLEQQDDGSVPCVILEQLPDEGDESACNALDGREIPDATVLRKYRDGRRAELGDELANAEQKHPVCQIVQLTKDQLDSSGSCDTSTAAGWCYVSGTAAGKCAQSIKFSPTSQKSGSKIQLQCIESSTLPQ